MIEAVCRLLGRPRRAPKERSLIDELSESRSMADRIAALLRPRKDGGG